MFRGSGVGMDKKTHQPRHPGAHIVPVIAQGRAFAKQQMPQFSSQAGIVKRHRRTVADNTGVAA